MTTTKCNGACIVHCVDGDDGTGGGGGGGDGEKQYLLPKKEDAYRPCPPYIPARYVLALMAFIGYISIFTLRMDLNIAILSIAEDGNGTVKKDNMTLIKPGRSWSENKQNMALSAFYYGYFSTQIIGGYLSGIYGGTRIMGLSVLFTSLVALATPSAIVEGYYLLVISRVVQGMAQGLAQPCMHTIWSKWAPKEEKAKLLTFSFSGCQLGNIVATVATGYMCEATPTLKWSLVFYVFGGVGLVWSVLWLLLVYETPRQHPRISRDELEYIERTSQSTDKITTRPPWCQMVLNPAFLAIVTAQVANDWGYLALSTFLPSYMKHILKYDIKENGFLSSLPYIVLLFTNPMAGYVADWLITRGVLTTRNSRRLMNSIGLLIPSALMVGVCFVGMNRNLTITLLTLALGFTGFTMAGYTVNHLDIAPPFAGLLYSMSNTLGTTTGFIGPAILSVLTEKHDTVSQWRIFFVITAAIFFIGGVVFLLLAEGEPQRWVRPYLQTATTNGDRGNNKNGDDSQKVDDNNGDDDDGDDDESDDNDDDEESLRDCDAGGGGGGGGGGGKIGRLLYDIQESDETSSEYGAIGDSGGGEKRRKYFGRKMVNVVSGE